MGGRLIESDDLLKFRIFQSASTPELELLSRAAKIVRFDKNSIIINENDEPTHVFFIQHGSCHVQLNGKSGKETIIKDLGSGDCFGEIGAFSNARRCASVVATENVCLIMMTSSAYINFCRNNLDAAQHTINVLSVSLSKITRDYQSLAMDDLTNRLVRTLFEVSSKNNNKLLVNLTHSQLANRTSSTRESVSRVIANLRNKGFIHTHDYEIEIDESLLQLHTQL